MLYPRAFRIACAQHIPIMCDVTQLSNIDGFLAHQGPPFPHSQDKLTADYLFKFE